MSHRSYSLVGSGCVIGGSWWAPLVQHPVDDHKRLHMMREPLLLYPIAQGCVMNEIVKVWCPLIGQRVGLYHWVSVGLHDFDIRMGW
jgi:hypothetical protein